ncbi:prepilin-type N-terminal cleavage/methylation domain-containing protein [bacterium]|nr:MAG: prepilin-type N-terminal cleavage/methylation domain-containing protein [bacterium]
MGAWLAKEHDGDLPPSGGDAMRRKQAFTLIELLVVMAITAVMMTLIVLPIFQSFNLTRNAQAFADAQDKARILTERISREVGNAISVRGGSSTPTKINVTNVTVPAGYNDTALPGTSLIARLPGKDGNVVETVLPNSKLDLIPPATGDPTRGPNGAFIDPSTGKEDPTLTRPKGDIRLPVAPGATVVRWFIGLKDPNRVYNEPYTGILQVRTGGADNLYVLRRAEVQPFVYRTLKTDADNTATRAWRPNLAYFRSDDETDTQIIDMDDPRFFIKDEGQNPDSDAQKNERVDNWLAKAVIQTEVSRYDMIRPLTAGPTGKPVATYDVTNTNVPKVVPLVQFVPTRVAAAPAAGSAAARPGEAVDGLDRIGPDTFQTERGLWTNAIIRYYPAGYDPTTATNLMEVASTDFAGNTAIYAGGSSASGLDAPLDPPNNFSLFSNTMYERTIAQGGAYPFTRAALAQNAWIAEPTMRALFAPFRVITSTGRIITSFPIEEVGVNALTGTPRPNLPRLLVGPSYSPTQATTADAGYASAPYSPVGTGTGAYDPNRAYNRAWNAYPQLQSLLQRFIDLRVVANEDGTFSPLNPVPAPGEVRGFSLVPQLSKDSGGNTVNSGALMNRVRIVPGSDEVYGPDQTVAGGYGKIVRYTRVSGNPGPNQYRLVYADLPEPVNENGLVDYRVLGIPNDILTGFDPSNYDANHVVSALIQPRFKAGYLQLCSDPNVPVPQSPLDASGNPMPITVRYRFQFNGPSDTFAVDYDTREVMQVLLTIKNYPQSNVPNAQLITLKSTATLRNALR